MLLFHNIFSFQCPCSEFIEDPNVIRELPTTGTFCIDRMSSVSCVSGLVGRGIFPWRFAINSGKQCQRRDPNGLSVLLNRSATSGATIVAIAGFVFCVGGGATEVTPGLLKGKYLVCPRTVIHVLFWLRPFRLKFLLFLKFDFLSVQYWIVTWWFV